jgi:uncharacterized membrane protein YdjX (TVP38/TMEM64 family)
MNGATGTEPSRLARQLPLLIIGVIIAALLAYSEEIHRQIVTIIALAEPVIATSPVLGAVIFVVLAALSAMLVFFSGLLLVPVGIDAWGPEGCFLLLWGGWFLGGLVTYSIGRQFGRPAVLRLVSAEKLARYENRIPESGSFLTAFLAQLVLPSDISGYFFGLLGYPPRVYLGSLMLAELPYALGTVYLGAAFMERQYLLLLAVAAVGLVVLALAFLRRRN